jgi:hypothetical protein
MLDSTRIRTELGWSPTVSSVDALREVLEGITRRAGVQTLARSPVTSLLIQECRRSMTVQRQSFTQARLRSLHQSPRGE